MLLYFFPYREMNHHKQNWVRVYKGNFGYVFYVNTQHSLNHSSIVCNYLLSANMVCHFTEKKFHDGDGDSNMGSSTSFNRKGATITEVPIPVLCDHSCTLYMYLSSSVLGSTEKGNERTGV